MRRVLIVFAKAPEPGRVKTRLARELGDGLAARIYRSLARGVVDAVRGGDYRTVVYFDPPDAEAAIRHWLPWTDLEFLPQPDGDLGRRLTHAFDWGFERFDFVGVVGTDIPELDASVVQAAFESLEGPDAADVCFGPALDGGYYLLALRSTAPSLFDGIPWSTERVLESSLARAKARGLRVAFGPTLADVDHPTDVPDALLREAEG